MGTRSTTTVFDESGNPLICLYRHFNGYYAGHGEELAKFLAEMNFVNGIGDKIPAKSANGMGCLAAQLIAHFKKEIGTFYIVPIGNTQEYDYEVRYSNGRVTLRGTCYHEPAKSFVLYSNEIVPVTILRQIQFVYDKLDGEKAKWRTVDVTAEDAKYITGFEGGKIKRFLVSKILGGKILPA